MRTIDLEEILVVENVVLTVLNLQGLREHNNNNNVGVCDLKSTSSALGRAGVNKHNNNQPVQTTNNR